MKSAAHVREGTLTIGFVILIGFQGCVHTPPSPLPDSIQQQIGRVGVLVRLTAEQEALTHPGSGQLGGAGRGAGIGVTKLAELTSQGGLGGTLVFVVGLPLVAAGGAIYGATVSESWQEADTILRTVVAELNLNRTVPERLAAFSRSHGYKITPLMTVSAEAPQERSRHLSPSKEGIDTVLEIQDLTVNLISAEDMVNPSRWLVLSARVQLIRAVDGAVLDDRVVTDELGPALELDDWMANQAALFRQEVRQASDRLAERIVTEYFMLYQFAEQMIAGDFGIYILLKGLAPRQPTESAHTPTIYRKFDEDVQRKYSSARGRPGHPPNYLGMPPEFHIAAQRSDSLQPSLSWEPLSGTNVTYDLKIWRAGNLGPESLVYDRANITQAAHKVEVTLDPSTMYYWSVRALFSKDGRDRMTEWSRRSLKYTLTLKIMTLGIFALAPDPYWNGFYVFITPPLEG